MKKEFKLSLEGLDCANCANKIEQKVNKLDEVEEANVNFSLGRMNVTMKDGLNKQDLINKITEIVKQLEPDVNVKEYIKNSQETYNATDKSTKFKLSLEGLDCANCANKIEKRVNNLSEVKEANINFSLGKLTIERNNSANKAEIVEKVKKIVSELEPDVVVSEDGEKHVHCHDGVCNCSEEEHEEKVNEKSGILGIIKENILFITGTVLYLIAIAVEHSIAQVWVLFIISYLLVGGKVLLTALKNLRRGQIFDENFLMSIATIGAIAIKQYPEAVAVMIFYEIGELFQGYAVNTSRKSITSLMNVRAEYANLLTKDGEIRVKPESVKIDDILVLKPGERVPLDGIIIDGTGSIDTSALTGESMPREVEENVEILSGSINLNSVIKMKVTEFK